MEPVKDQTIIYEEMIINIISEMHNSTLTLKINNQASLIFALQLMNVFSKVEYKDGAFNVVGNTYQQKTNKLLDDLRTFIQNNGNDQRAWQFYNVFANMPDGEHFAIVFHAVDKADRDIIIEDIINLNHPDYELFKQFKEEVMDGVLNNYDLVHYQQGNKQIRIGESVKDKRKCRFCGQSMPVVKFKNDSHTISEGLGNKTIITNDECDTCNGDLGREIEQDLMTYISPLRSLFAVEGKNGKTKVKDDSFALYLSDTGEYRIDLMQKDELEKQHWTFVEKSDDAMKVSFTHPQMVNIQDVYRAVVKYALGVMDAAKLSHFQDTITWVRKKKSASDLPMLCIFLDNDPKNPKKPTITVFTRKSDNKELPYSYEALQVSGVEIFAIIPFCDADDRTFSAEADWTRVMDVLKIYRKMPLLKAVVANDDNPQRITYNFEFKKNKDTQQTK